MISGTIYNAGKMLQMTQKLEQKKAAGNLFKKEVKEISPEEKQFQMYQEQLEKAREGNEYSAIYAKIQSGQSLSPEEEAKIRARDPKLYMEYKADKQEQEAYEKKLKSCKTKEEAERLHVNRMNGKLSELKSIVNNPNIPKSEKLKEAQRILGDTTKTTQIYHSFTRSAEYQKMPREEELLEAMRAEAESQESVTAEESTAQESMSADENIITKTLPEDENIVTKTLPEDENIVPETLPKEGTDHNPVKSERMVLEEMRKLEKQLFGGEKKTVKIDISL